MPSGIKVVTETEGTGHRAEKGDIVVFDCAASLNKGSAVHARRTQTLVLGSRRFIAGVEYAFAPHWSVKLEYLYLDFGRESTTWTLGALPSITDDARFTMNVVRAGVNYRF